MQERLSYQPDLYTCFYEFHLFTAALSELENLSQHIPKEILLNKDNIQLSNFIGEGDEIEWNLMCLSCSVLGLRSSLSSLGS